MKNKVKNYRVLYDHTQQELALVIGVSRQTIHAIETGKYVPSTVLALKMAKLFKCEVSDLFELEGNE